MFLLIIWKLHAMHPNHTHSPFLSGPPSHPCATPTKQWQNNKQTLNTICVAHTLIWSMVKLLGGATFFIVQWLSLVPPRQVFCFKFFYCYQQFIVQNHEFLLIFWCWGLNPGIHTKHMLPYQWALSPASLPLTFLLPFLSPSLLLAVSSRLAPNSLVTSDPPVVALWELGPRSVAAQLA